MGAPPDCVGLAVEVVSPSSRRTDRILKPAEYAAAGIPLYWRVEQEPDVEVHAYRLQDGVYAPVSLADGRCPVPWGEIALDLSELR